MSLSKIATTSIMLFSCAAAYAFSSTNVLKMLKQIDNAEKITVIKTGATTDETRENQTTTEKDDQPDVSEIFSNGVFDPPTESSSGFSMPLYSEILVKSNFNYGNSRFTKRKYKTSDIDEPQSDLIEKGFHPSNDIRIFMDGKLSPQIDVIIDYDNSRDETENSYSVKYRAAKDDEVLREINIGDIDINFGKSQFATYQNRSQKGLGFDAFLEKSGFSFKGFASVTKGASATDRFSGNSVAGSINLREYQFIRNRYFQIEPFKRYDNLSSPPALSSPNDNYITLKSNPSNPETYRPFSVNIVYGSLEIFLDDQISTNNSSATKLSLDGGYYSRLSEGVDYTVNCASGVISFLRDVGDNMRIYALYKLSGSSSDPFAVSGVVSGKYFVFLKYGRQTDEFSLGQDINGDGVIGYDIHEIRSYYYLGAEKIQQGDFSLSFSSDGGLLTSSEKNMTGIYSVDYEKGFLRFNLREPFKAILGSDAASYIYSPVFSSSAYTRSEYFFSVEYSAKRGSIQLSHMNIIDGSVSLEIDGKKIDRKKYTLDKANGIIEFPEGTYPYGENSDIVVNYQYLNESDEDTTFTAGGRAEYKWNRFLTTGSSLIYSRASSVDAAPLAGNEPLQNTVAEADASVSVSRKDMNKVLKTISGGRIAAQPFKINGYFEYALSRTNTNTYGLAIADDFESSNETQVLSTSDKDWVLSSPGQTQTQAGRGRLLFKYYRDLDGYSLQGESFAYRSVDYAQKTGPYNIKSGPFTDSDDNRSLVFDYVFSSSENFVSVMAPLSSEKADLSSLQYLEVTYKSLGADGTVDLSFDVGNLSEDSDGDGILDTEDLNLNGKLDNDPNGIFEDSGYRFNPSSSYSTVVGSGPKLNSQTRGDGVLSTEDINSNGRLDTSEQIFTFPSAAATIPGMPTLNVSQTDTSWKTVKIYLNKSSLSDSQLTILKAAEAIRINITKVTAGSGRLFISSIKLVSSSWRLDDSSSSVMRLSLINKFNDSEYAANSFEAAHSGEMKKLYDVTNDELKEREENALKLEYFLSASASPFAYRKYSRTMDFSKYSRLYFWVFTKSFSSEDVLHVTIGSSENDTATYDFPIASSGEWIKNSISLKSSAAAATEGFVDFKRIKYIKTSITSSGTGEIWINNFCLDGAKILKDAACYAEGSIEAEKPLFVTQNGTPVVSDFMLKYKHYSAGKNFSNPGKTGSDMRERYNEISQSMNILPLLYYDMSFLDKNTDSDDNDTSLQLYERGKADFRSFSLNGIYGDRQKEDFLITFNYSHQKRKSVRNADFNNSLYRSHYKSSFHSPKISVKTAKRNTTIGSFSFTGILDTSFKKTVKGGKGNIPEELREKEKSTQYESITIDSEYQNSLFSVHPIFNSLIDSTVCYDSGALSDGSISTNVRSGYYIPFIQSPKDIKFNYRSHSFFLSTGIKPVKGFSPVNEITLTNTDSYFSDFSTYERSLFRSFKRQKGSTTTTGEKLSFLHSNESGIAKWLKNISLIYSRNFTLYETGTPFEGENSYGYFSSKKEKYGMGSRFAALSPVTYNFLKYPFWYFFTGRRNFAKGRDIVYKTENSPLYDNGNLLSDYSNDLSMKDSFSFNSVTGEGFYTGTYNASLWQNVDRSETEGIPQQSVNFSFSADTSFNMAKLLNLKFDPPKKSIIKNQSLLSLDIGYRFSRNMLITQNVVEYTNSPSTGITLGMNDSSVEMKYSIEFRNRYSRDYIPTEEKNRSASDEIYFYNLPDKESAAREIGHKFSVEFSTGVLWLHDIFSEYYILFSYPVFRAGYALTLNRYNYENEAAPDSYDSHVFSTELDLNIHQNIKGEFTGKAALEKWRNRDDKKVNREIVSYEVGFSLVLQY